ncbi:MAG: Gfo/Idh/MocA family protein [Anaerolineae bacterium]|jgi:predicted dehydrogenase|nr:Gfo/Idh/MocA family oxidoreductase [Chloroflexota bacterium]
MLKAGIVGAGILGGAHAENLRAHPQVELVAVADPRMEAAQRLAGSDVRAYRSVEEMLGAESLDLVVVATPDPFHREPTLAAIAAGVPYIIQEKPLATTLSDALAIYEAVERAGTGFYVNYANRTAPLDIATAYVIRQGLLGPIVYGDVRLDDNISVPTRLWGTRSRDWAGGSSTAHFLLSHVVDLLHWYLYPATVSEVYAIKQQMVLGYTPDLYDAFLTFTNGAQIRVKAEWIRHMDELVEFGMSFSGAQGTLVYNKLPGFGTRTSWRANLSPEVAIDSLLQHQQALRSAGALTRAIVDRGAPGLQRSPGAEELLPVALESLDHGIGKPMALVDHVIDAILEGSNPPHSWGGPGSLPTHVDGLAQTQVVLAIVASAEKHHPVRPDSLA